MTGFVEAAVDDGVVTATDTNKHTWKVSFAGERPLIEQVFSADPPAETDEDETDEETETEDKE